MYLTAGMIVSCPQALKVERRGGSGVTQTAGVRKCRNEGSKMRENKKGSVIIRRKRGDAILSCEAS